MLDLLCRLFLKLSETLNLTVVAPKITMSFDSTNKLPLPVVFFSPFMEPGQQFLLASNPGAIFKLISVFSSGKTTNNLFSKMSEYFFKESCLHRFL